MFEALAVTDFWQLFVFRILQFSNVKVRNKSTLLRSMVTVTDLCDLLQLFGS